MYCMSIAPTTRDALDGTDIAIAHEHFPEIGGGEHVALELGRLFSAPVYTGFVNDGIDIGEFDIPVVDLFGNGLLGKLIQREGAFANLVRDAYYQFAWTHVPELYKRDVIIQSGNNPGWFVPAFDRQVVIKYTHSPPRTPYDLYEEYGEGKITSLYTKAARQTYPATVTYPDLVIANSDVVARRLRRALGVEDDRIRVIYPPVDVDQYSPDRAPTGDYYLAWSRLRDAKQIHWIAETFADLDAKLVIGGKGPKADAIRQYANANDNIDYVGYMSASEKQRRVSEAKAAVFAARNEDFGMVPIEAMAAGTPVVGVSEGMTQYQIVDGENGVHFERGKHNLKQAIERFELDGVELSESEIAGYAQQYSCDRFAKEMQQAVIDAQERAAIKPEAIPPTEIEPEQAPAEPTHAPIVGDGGQHDE